MIAEETSTQWAAAELKVDNNAIKKLSQLSPWKSIAAIAAEWAIIIGAASLHNFFPSPWLYFPVWLLISTRLYALYSLIHEAIHFSITRNKGRNDIIAQLFLGLPLFIDLQKMRAFHYEHHKYLHTEKDPEQKHLQYKEFRFPWSRTQFFLIALKDLSGYNFVVYKLQAVVAWVLSKEKFKAGNSSKTIYRVFYTVLFIAAFYFHFADELLLYWIIPFATLYQFLNRIRLSTEHFNLEEENPYHTRTLILGKLKRFFLAPYNLGYHLEHHLYPGVPFYNLPVLHELLLEHEEFSRSGIIQTGYRPVFKNLVK